MNKSQASWDRLYKAYQRQYKERSKRYALKDILPQNVFEAQYNSFKESGVKQNITRTMIESRSYISTKQRAKLAKASKIKYEEDLTKLKELKEVLPKEEYKAQMEILKAGKISRRDLQLFSRDEEGNYIGTDKYTADYINKLFRLTSEIFGYNWNSP